MQIVNIFARNNMAWNCAICGFTCLLLSILLTHYSSRHANNTSFTIRCNLNGCARAYSNVKSFVRHAAGIHAAFSNCRGPSETEGEPTFTAKATALHVEAESDLQIVEEALHLENDDCSNGDISADDANDDFSIEDGLTENIAEEIEGDTLSKFLFKIKEENKLTQTCVQQIATVTKKLFQGAVGRMKRKAEQCLSNAGVDSANVPGFDAVFSDEVLDYNDVMVSNLETFHNREGINIPFIEPQKHVLGRRRVVRKRGSKRRILMTEDAFYYIPLLRSLEIQLRSKTILGMILSGPDTSQNENVLSDFCDGTVFQNHELFSNDPSALQILLYFDDINLSNPLTNKVHKITLFYYQLGNIRKEYRSKLDSIHLFAVCKTSYMRLYGLNSILEPLVKELKSLGSNRGYPFRVLDGHVQLRGAILAFLADTPASHLAGAFKESVGGARKKCRHCMASFETMNECFTEEEFTLRNELDHEEQLNLIENAPTKFLKEYYSKLFGVNGRSKLEEAPYFNVCQQLPQDVMHVFLEGVISYELKYLLNFYIKEKGYFTLADLNNGIQGFPYGYSHIKDKPCLIKESDLERQSSSNLGQGAARMWLLAQVLPLILSSLVDTDTEHWACFASLLELMAISFSYTICQETILYLKTAVKEHLALFKRVFPDAPIIPKQHFLVHLPSQLFKFGPLIRSWCMRFEGKHAYFKDLSKKIKNFKNIALSLASKHQKIECAKNMTVDDDFDGTAESSSLFGSDVIFGRSKNLQGNDKESARREIERFHPLDFPAATEIMLCNSVTLKGTKYTPGKNNLLHIGYDPFGLPEFGSLVKIWFVVDVGVFFVTKVMESVAFQQELNAIEIEDASLPQGLHVVRPDDLPFFQVHHCYKSGGKTYIPFRQYVFDHQ